MRAVLIIPILFLVACGSKDDETLDKKSGQKTVQSDWLNPQQASRLASLPLKCIEQEYPNKLGQVLNGPMELESPKRLHPVFYGCFDWHSSVHGHWLLLSLINHYPDLPEKRKIITLLDRQFTARKCKQEVAFFKTRFNESFERTYGWAWLMKLYDELDRCDFPEAQRWKTNLKPLRELLVLSLKNYLPKLLYPIRTGEHTNTAFGLSLAWDHAVATGDEALRTLIRRRCEDYYSHDRRYNFDFEPGGNDFISPGLQEIELMSKVLPSPEDFRRWLKQFAPQLLRPDFRLAPGQVSDRSDGKLVHLDGLNFNRAWCLYTIARQLPKQTHLRRIADEHVKHSLPAITDGDYMGEHWLASFAWYALLARQS